jgi:chromosome segregation and condensation protein ScpB
VNSTFIIRNLLIRGLIERVDDDKDKRQFRYRPTIDLLSHLGLSKVDDLPEFTLVKSELEKLNETKEEDGKEPATGEHNG